MKIILILIFIEVSGYCLGQKDVKEIQILITPFSDISAQTISPGSQIQNLPPIQSTVNYKEMHLIGSKINSLIEKEKIPGHLKYLDMMKRALQESIEKNDMKPLREAIETVLLLVEN